MVSAAQPEPAKILAIGSPSSQLTTSQQKVEAINAKHGPFDACIIVGDLFKADSDGSESSGISSPVSTYFTVGRNALPESVQESSASGPEVAPNLVFIGKSNISTTAQGSKIAAVGGAYDEATYASDDNSQTSPVMTKAGIQSVSSHSVSSPAADGSSSAAKDAATALPSAFQGVDVLSTTSPPPSLSLLSPSFSTSGVQLANSAPPSTDVVKAARPRYLFWSEGPGFWEREPFGWPGPNGKDERWTRAIKLGPLGAIADGGKPARWFYATSSPAQTATTAPPVRPANATPNPSTMPSGSAGKKRAGDEAEGDAKRGKTEEKKDRGPPPDSYVCKICHIPGHWIQECPDRGDKDKESNDPSKPREGYVCKICQSSEHHIRDCPQKGRGRPPPAGYVCKACGAKEEHYVKDCPVVREREQQRGKRKESGPAECWFCLSNPKVTKHLIVGIGKETYVTLPKGQSIPTHGAAPSVPGGGHVLIIPIAHHPTLLSIPASDALEIVSEVEAYKSALRDCYAAYGAVPVAFEVGRSAGRGGHAHVQVIPVPKELGPGVAEAFRKAGEASGLAWEDEPERALARVGPAGNYFKVECPDGTKMVHSLKGNFDSQFGRMVLAGILGLHHRVNWKDCVQSEGDDKDDAQKFKKAFAPYAPS